MRRLGKAVAAVVIGLLGIGLFASSALAQGWPQRSVRFIVPLGPGSGVDIGSRLLADRLGAKWKQSVVVENRPGGDAVVAINAFIGANDDHVLLYTPTSSFTAHPYQLAKVPYNLSELTPIARITSTLLGVVVWPGLKVDTLAQLIARIKAEPGKLNYSTATGMTDVIFDGYFKSANLVITRVPYRDVVAPLTDLGEGRIQAYIGALAIVQPHIQAGRARLLAVTNSQRALTYPDIPTVAEAGFEAMTFDGLTGLFGPRSMPDAVRSQIAADIREALTDQTIASRFTATGQVLSPGSAAEFAASIEGQRSKLAGIAKQLGITAAMPK